MPRLANLQTKYLVGNATSTRPHVDAAALADAKANLDRLAFGVTESVRQHRWRCSWSACGFGIPKFDVANVSRGTHDDDLLSDEFRAVARPPQRSRPPAVRLRGASCCGRASTELRERAARRRRPTSRPLDGILRFRRQRIEHGDPAAAPTSVAAARILRAGCCIDGRPADAAFVRVGDEVIPLVPRIERSDAARGTHNLHNRDRGRGRHAAGPARRDRRLELARVRPRPGVCEPGARIEIVRVEPAPLTTRLPAAVKNRVGKLLGR